MKTIAQSLDEHLQIIETVKNTLIPDIQLFADHCRTALQAGHTIYFMGNGGSAADCQHLAAELVGRFQCERRGLSAIALTTDTSIITSIGNDYGYELVFARQVEALVGIGDVVVGISTSGNSVNVVQALSKARQCGAVTIGMTGQNAGQMASLCDLCIKVPSDRTARVQEAHILIGHIMCQLVDEV